MKSTGLRYLVLLYSMLLQPWNGASQCVPDTVNCKDVGEEPGQICPAQLPPAVINSLYHVVVTILPPDSALSNQTMVPLHGIMIESVKNLPPGIEYIYDKIIMYPDSAYCAELQGTPTTLGDYTLEITVIPYVNILGTIVALLPVTDNTSLAISVREPSGWDDPGQQGEEMLMPYPNPFRHTTRIGFFFEGTRTAELVIKNLVGQEVYHEVMVSGHGLNYFMFSGSSLVPGIYISSVRSGGKTFSRKLVKLKE